MKVIAISKNSSFATLITALFAVAGLLIITTLKTLIRAFKIAFKWLKDTHNFTPGEIDEDEKLYLTGWQYLLFSVLFLVFGVLVSIKY